MIAIRPGADDDLQFTTAASYCGEAADELCRVYPDMAEVVSIPAIGTYLEGLPNRDAASWLLEAVRTCIFDFDVEDPGLRPVDMLAAGTAATWLGLAHHAISGRLP